MLQMNLSSILFSNRRITVIQEFIAILQADIYFKFLSKSLFALLALYAIFFLLNVTFPLRVSIEYSTIITSDNGTVLKAFLTSDDKWRMMTELDEITPEM